MKILKTALLEKLSKYCNCKEKFPKMLKPTCGITISGNHTIYYVTELIGRPTCKAHNHSWVDD